jgi:hypothetical protein
MVIATIRKIELSTTITKGKYKMSKEESKIDRSIKDLASAIKNYGLFSKLLKENDITLDKNLRIEILKEVLKDYVAEKRKEKEGTADDYRYRLGFFVIYSEYQLQNLLFGIKRPDLEEEYITKLYHAIEAKLTDPKIIKVVSTTKTKFPASIEAIDKDLNSVFVDKGETFDALDVDLLRPVLYHASYNEEIRQLGLKYGVTVPTRLKKAELVECILGYFTFLDEAKVEEIRSNLMTLPPTLISRFAKDNNILVSQDFKKEEIIEYILKHNNITAAAYRRPYSRKAYYFTDEQKEKYGLVEVKAYEEEPSTPATKEKEIVYVDRVIERTIETPVEVAEPEKKSTGWTVFLIILLILGIVALILVIYFVFFAGLTRL